MCRFALWNNKYRFPSYICQVRTLNNILKTENWLSNPNETIVKLNNFFEFKNIGLIDSINFIINFYFNLYNFLMK